MLEKNITDPQNCKLDEIAIACYYLFQIENTLPPSLCAFIFNLNHDQFHNNQNDSMSPVNNSNVMYFFAFKFVPSNANVSVKTTPICGVHIVLIVSVAYRNNEVECIFIIIVLLIQTYEYSIL